MVDRRRPLLITPLGRRALPGNCAALWRPFFIMFGVIIVVLMVGCVRFEKINLIEGDGLRSEQVKRYWGPSWQEIRDNERVMVVSDDDGLTTRGLVISEFETRRREGTTELHLFDMVKDVVSSIVGLIAGLVL